jgi:hypothetical protein
MLGRQESGSLAQLKTAGRLCLCSNEPMRFDLTVTDPCLPPFLAPLHAGLSRGPPLCDQGHIGLESPAPRVAAPSSNMVSGGFRFR